MNKALAHFITITRHRHMVIKHCRYAGIMLQSLNKDPGIPAVLYSGTEA